jgi:hypothetical protein
MKTLSITFLILCGAINGAFAQTDEGPQYVTKQLPPATVFLGTRNRGDATALGRTPFSKAASAAARSGRQAFQPSVQAQTVPPGQNAVPANAANSQPQKITRLVYDQFGRPYLVQLNPKVDPSGRPIEDTKQPKPKTPQELAHELAVLQSQRFFRDIYRSRNSTHNQTRYNYTTHNISRSNQSHSGLRTSNFSTHNQSFRPSFHNQTRHNQSNAGYSFHLQGSAVSSHLYR